MSEVWIVASHSEMQFLSVIFNDEQEAREYAKALRHMGKRVLIWKAEDVK